MASSAPRRLRPLPDLPVLVVTVAMALAFAAAGAQAAPTTAPSQLVDAFRLDARGRAAASLAADGHPDDARLQLERAAQGPLAALTASSANEPLRSAFGRLRSAVDGGDVRAVRAAADRLTGAVSGLAGREVAGADAVRSVLIALVREAGREGLEAAAKPTGTPAATEPGAYASALAAIAVDQAQRFPLGGTARDALQTLRSALGADAASAATLRSATDNALAALGAPPSADDTARLLRTIDVDLDRAVASYRAGDAGGAREALIDAYLENFEDLEPSLAAAAPELEQRLEHTLRDELRALVAQGAPADRFEAAVKSARADLERARKALE
jgi:hypothetical protein